MTIDDIIKKRLDRIDGIPDLFTEGVAKIQSELFAELMAFVSEINTKSFSLTESQLVDIDQIFVRYYESLKKGKYGAAVSYFISEMDAQAAINQNYFEKAFEYSISENAIASNNRSKKRALRLLINDDFKTNFLNVIKDDFISALAGGGSFDEVRNLLGSKFISNESVRDPVMLRWAKQVSSDVFAIADREFNEVAASDLGLNFFQYSGGTIKDTRAFCKVRAEKVYHKNEAKDWADQSWQGKHRSTSEATIMSYLGGYNCQHVAVYISLVNVPMTVIERNISNGNYRPGAPEKSLLGL